MISDSHTIRNQVIEKIFLVSLGIFEDLAKKLQGRGIQKVLPKKSGGFCMRGATASTSGQGSV